MAFRANLVRMRARNGRRQLSWPPVQDTGKSEQTPTEPGCAHDRPARIGWARLLKRVFEIDLEHCPHCGGQLRIIATILESAVIDRILTHLRL